ncbi:MAG TPA: hypothetical protein VFF12_03450 [Myxococcaceae bacterium]|nr:hypothetical protein [Myxococcaceae bacterium]
MRPLRLLVQCSIPFTEDDWHVGRFSALVETLRGLRQADGSPLAVVTARNREVDRSGLDPVLAGLDCRDWDELWLLGVDGGEACGDAEVAAIDAFQRAGGGLLTARDHQNMGLWLRKLRSVGAANCFNAESCREPDQSRWSRDDEETRTIDFPNYHSGSNGDAQPVSAVEPLHPLLMRAGGGRIEWLPSHPHEGAVVPPPGDARARPVARGRSITTGRPFNLSIAFERSGEFAGRGVSESSFHHFADYNWNPAVGAPSFVTEKPGSGLKKNPTALEHTRAYVENLARWLAPSDLNPGT